MRYLKYITAVVAGVSLVGCSSFLEENPDQRTTLDNSEKIKELLVFAYPQTNNIYPLETMTDNVGDSKKTQDTKVDNVAYYAWEDEKQEDADSPGKYWETAYGAIAQANQALEAIEKIKTTTSKETYEGIKGEALLARAYAHWMLAMTFCESYDPNTAGSKLGIPYVDEVEDVLIKEYKRGTLEEVYTKIEADLEEGIPLIKGENFYKSPKYHFTKDAAHAFAARFYTFKGDWEKVMTYTNFLGDWPSNLRNYNVTSGGGNNSQTMQAFSDVKEPANLLIAGTNSTLVRSYYENRFGYTRNEVNQTVWSPKHNPFKGEWMHLLLTYNQELVYMARFYEYFVYTNQSAGIGHPYQNIPLLTTDEVYMYRIEATIMAGEYDKAAQMIGYLAKNKTRGGGDHTKITSATLLNVVQAADEYQPFYNLNDTQRRLIKYLAEVRRVEFMQLSNRWYDIKRYNLEVTHTYLIEGKTEVLTANDLRKAIQLPQSALGAGLTPNPR